MIDKLIERREEQRIIEAEERARKREQAKADARQAREKERLSAKRKKTEDELQTLAGAMGDPSYKPRKSRTKKMQDLRDFQHLVNRIIADSVIEPSEIIEVKEWLESHKLRPDEFSTTIAARAQSRRLAHPGVLARSRSRPRRLAPCPLAAHARRYGASVAACAYP